MILHIAKTVLPFVLLLLCSSGTALSAEVVRVKQVYDGDTVLLEDGRKVRYLGINAPEWQEPYYLKAKRLNEALVLGKEVRLEFDEEQRDTYGRLLAYVYAGDLMVNAKLIEEGLAHAFFFPLNRKHNTPLLRLQEGARDRKAGIWSRRGRTSVLKITSVHPPRHAGGAVLQPYVRIANISSRRIGLAGYTLSAEAGPSYTFPAVSLEPGFTVLVVSGEGTDGITGSGQLTVHWKDQAAVWDPEENTAYLSAPDGTPVDSYHYKERRVSRKSSRKKAGQ